MSIVSLESILCKKSKVFSTERRRRHRASPKKAFIRRFSVGKLLDCGSSLGYHRIKFDDEDRSRNRNATVYRCVLGESIVRGNICIDAACGFGKYSAQTEWRWDAIALKPPRLQRPPRETNEEEKQSRAATRQKKRPIRTWESKCIRPPTPEGVTTNVSTSACSKPNAAAARDRASRPRKFLSPG